MILAICMVIGMVLSGALLLGWSICQIKGLKKDQLDERTEQKSQSDKQAQQPSAEP